MRLILLTPLLMFAACKPGDTDTAGGTGYPGPTEPPAPDCNAYEYRGTEYNCSTLDRCDNSAENLSSRLACCECDPALCNPDLTCPPPDACVADPTLPECLPPEPPPPVQPGQSSCMTCHNGALPGSGLYSGPGISNPHPFGSAAYLDCTSCHGGNAAGQGRQGSHVPVPPQIGNDQNLTFDAVSYFNYLTSTGADKYPNYTVDGTDYSPLDWIQFRNPGDMRIVSQGRGCGATGCHGDEHGKWFSMAPINTEMGFYSATMYTTGSVSFTGVTYWEDTSADLAFRAIEDPSFVYTGAADQIGRVPRLVEFPEYAQYGQNGGNYIYNNPDYNAAALDNDVHDGTILEAGRVFSGSNLEKLVMEVVALNCGDCHAGSNGANNRYADFRSSGCTACHMQYSKDGKSRSTDPNVPKNEPANPDAIAAPERSHVDSHQIRNVAKFIQGGFVRGISDVACVGCHQGSNRTVLQFWGIRLDQNQDVVNGFQYPTNPITFQTTAADTRLYDPGVANQTFNGRVAEQYLLFEDYDGDGRDDTPSDIHYEAGMGCIDCHGSADLHGGANVGPEIGIRSHQDQHMGTQCENCHGGVDNPPPTVPCVDYAGQSAECAVDRLGRPLRNVTKDSQGYFWLRGRVYGQTLFVPLTKDVVDQGSQRVNPLTGQTLFSPLASYAMGRVDNDNSNGVGPLQTNAQALNRTPNFAHEDKLECIACHATWNNNCVGCHLAPEYNADPANFFFSNTTGDRIALNFAADFVYQSPVMFNLGIGSTDRITQVQPGMKMFFRYTDFNGDTSNVFAFTDRKGNGNNPNVQGRGAFGALAHNKIMPHSTRGKIDTANEGPRYCNACHLTFDMDLAAYAAFKATYLNGDYANLDFAALAAEIGAGTNNAQNSPIWVHMVSGQGSGLFAFDANGCPVNALDNNANRQFCNNVAPAVFFANNNANDFVVYDLDKMVEPTGVSNSSNAHPLLTGTSSINRIGARYPQIAGPMGIDLLERLTDENSNFAIILDSYIDSNANAQGDAALYIP